MFGLQPPRHISTLPKLPKNSSEHMFRLKNLPKSVPDYLDTLRAWGLLATIKASEPFDQFV